MHGRPESYGHRPSHPYNDGPAHVGFSPTGQTLLAPSASVWGAFIMACMAVVVRPYTLASLQCRTEHVVSSPTRQTLLLHQARGGRGGKRGIHTLPYGVGVEPVEMRPRNLLPYRALSSHRGCKSNRFFSALGVLPERGKVSRYIKKTLSERSGREASRTYIYIILRHVTGDHSK